MTDDVDDYGVWTEASAERLRAAAGELRDAVTAHAETLATLDPNDTQALFQANEFFLPAVLEYAEAQGFHTGTFWPFGAIEEFAEEDEDDEFDGEDEDAGPVDVVSILQRHDYAVRDADAVLRSGREAYMRAWPEDSEDQAIAEVTSLGRALYQIAHADGWDHLTRVEGLRPLAGLVFVVNPDEVLDVDDDEPSPDDLVPDEAEILYSQAGIWG